MSEVLVFPLQKHKQPTGKGWWWFVGTVYEPEIMAEPMKIKVWFYVEPVNFVCALPMGTLLCWRGHQEWPNTLDELEGDWYGPWPQELEGSW